MRGSGVSDPVSGDLVLVKQIKQQTHRYKANLRTPTLREHAVFPTINMIKDVTTSGDDMTAKSDVGGYKLNGLI